MNYLNFEVEDFAVDDYFIRWVVDNDPQATLFWEAFKADNPEMVVKIDRARALLINLQHAEQGYSADDQIDRTWQNIRNAISQAPPKKSFPALKIAASVSVIVVLSVLWFGRGTGYFFRQDQVTSAGHTNTDDLIEEKNDTGSASTVHLDDGSIVILEPNSCLKFSRDWGDAPFRKVYLTGEAFFDVARKPQQPFYVYANEVVTKVLGTSFRVKTCDDEESVVVSVMQGKVSVYSEKSQRTKQDLIESEVNGVVLMPNQQVVYGRTEDSFNKTLVDNPEIVKEDALHYDFEFHNTPVKEVFGRVAEAYGVEIIFDEEALEHCYLTAPLTEEPLFEKLKIICRTIEATYELIDANIVISGKGCGRGQTSGTDAEQDHSGLN